MGCCLSSGRGQNQRRRDPPPDLAGDDRAPPPVDEETVKEVVLSEPPVSKTLPLQALPQVEKQSNKVADFQVAEVEIAGDRRVSPPGVAEEIVSEQSEMCSFTESISTTATERRDDDEVNQRSPARGPPRKRRVNGDLAGGRERNYRSPARKPVTSSMVGQSRPVASQGRNVGPQNAAARRSRSPATRRREVRNQSPAAGERRRSPARVAEKSNKDSKAEKQRPNDVVLDKKSPNDVVLGRKSPNDVVLEEKPTSNDVVSEETGESLENPLVSLECFIFL